MTNFLIDIQNTLLPEVILGVFALINFACAFLLGREHFKLSKIITLSGIMLALSQTFFLQISPNYYGFSSAILSNAYTVFFKILILMSGFLVVMLSRYKIRKKREIAFEYFGVLLCAIVGGLLAVSANNFLVLFIALQILAVSSSVLLCFSENESAKEFATKYLTVNSIGTGLILVGAAYIYSVSGSINFTDISQYFIEYDPNFLFLISSLLIFMGFGVNIFAMPFIFHLSDLFENATYPTIAFLSSVLLCSGLGAFAKIYVFVLQFGFLNKLFLAAISIIAMTIAAFAMTKASNMKRFLGYSTMLQSGYMIFGLSVLSVYSLSGMLFYMIAYLCAVFGIIAACALFNSSIGNDELEGYKTLAYNRPFYAIALSGCLLSLGGTGVCAGFIAKVYLLSAIARSGFIFLPALFWVFVIMMVGFYGYFRVIIKMFEPAEKLTEIEKKVVSTKFILYACFVAVLILFFFPQKIVQLCQSIAYYI